MPLTLVQSATQALKQTKSHLLPYDQALAEILKRLIGTPMTNKQLLLLVAAMYSLIVPGRQAQLGVADTLAKASAEAVGIKDLTIPTTDPLYPMAATTALVKRTIVDRLRAGKRSILIPQDADMTAAAANRHIRQAGRDRILQSVGSDDRVQGWARMGTGLEKCAFCDLLISRGPVYRSLETASFTSHDNCDCIAVPVLNKRDWAGKDHADELYKQWQSVTEGYSGADAINAWRRHRESLTPATQVAA